MKQTSYDLSELVMDAKAKSTRKIGEELDMSASYVCMMQRARVDCAPPVIDAWRERELPFELVRQLMYLPHKKQLSYLRIYLNATKNKNKTEKGKARKVMLGVLKAARAAIVP